MSMTELVFRFEHLVGRAALKLWSDLPRDLQERLFEDAMGGDERLRHHLAVYLHDHHPRTKHPPTSRGPSPFLRVLVCLKRRLCCSSATPLTPLLRTITDGAKFGLLYEV